MKAELLDIGDGWFELFLALERSELDLLRERLASLESEGGHFHWRRDQVEPKGGIA